MFPKDEGQERQNEGNMRECKRSQGCWTLVVYSVELLGREGERRNERGTRSCGR